MSFSLSNVSVTWDIRENVDTEVTQNVFISNMDNSTRLLLEVKHECHCTNVNHQEKYTSKNGRFLNTLYQVAEQLQLIKLTALYS